MKNYNFEWFERAPKSKPLEQSVLVNNRGIRMGKSFVQGLELDKVPCINVGIDREGKAACIKPSDKGFFLRYTKKPYREVSGKDMAKEVSDVVGTQPHVSLVDGVAILTPQGGAISQEQTATSTKESKLKRKYKPREKKLTETKKKGRPPKQIEAKPQEPKISPIDKEPIKVIPPERPSDEVSEGEEFKEMCSNCDYHRPIRGIEGRVHCDKLRQDKNFDAYCFKYEPELNA
jgi:hypothetical protein